MERFRRIGIRPVCSIRKSGYGTLRMRASALNISTIERMSFDKMDASSKEAELNGCLGELLSPSEKFQSHRSLLNSESK